MRIERFDPLADTPQIRACYEVYAAGLPEDDPDVPPMSPRVFAVWLGQGWNFAPREAWLASGGEQENPPGAYVLELPERENKHMASLMLWVHPSRRRAGLGSALLRHAAGRARERGRRELSGDARENAPGSAFAAAAGAGIGLTEVRRILDLTSIPGGHLDALRRRAEAASGGYSLLSWTGAVPEEYLDQAAALDNAMADAPHSPGVEPEIADAEQIRKSDERAAAMGVRRYTVAARCDRTGELAGLTAVGVDPETPAWGYQELTAVTRPHRGHRLGLLVKVAMLGLLAEAEPQLERMVTGNADANSHMIAINADLGYRVLDRWHTWQLDVTQPA